ncbi:hypothetical protein BaRGS_00009025 [Batillaria attramentaria]|uniref:Uncharacterized protein n=1 Tax=Batillaria attramentaria TaxID=370345 RepID=A0ABD0LJJ4_9CAEN
MINPLSVPKKKQCRPSLLLHRLCREPLTNQQKIGDYKATTPSTDPNQKQQNGKAANRPENEPGRSGIEQAAGLISRHVSCLPSLQREKRQ